MTALAVVGPQIAPIAKKVNRNRVKSAFRDAQFRPLFQGVAALEELEASGGTSVTLSTPYHPSASILQIKLPSTASTPSASPTPTPTPTSPIASKSSAPAFPVETLTDAEEERSARFWRPFNAALPTPRKHVLPARWRELSDIGALEWFHYALRAGGPSMAFSLNLSPDVEAQTKTAASSAGWLSKRIARNLAKALGRKVNFWFAFEVENRRLHVHGEFAIDIADAPAARKALRLAGGEWVKVRQHQAHTRERPTVVWPGYTAKHSIFVRPLTGRFAGISPINGDWFFATNAIRKSASIHYETRRIDAIILMATLKYHSLITE